MDWGAAGVSGAGAGAGAAGAASADAVAAAAGAGARPGEPTCCAYARELVRGAVELEELPYGWVRPWRFSAGQRRALASCLAWYPGIFRQMATCTAGIRLEFETDASEVFIEVRTDREPRATRNVLRGMKPEVGDANAAHDGFSFDVDGKHRAGEVRLGPVAGSYAAATAAAAMPGEWAAGITLELGELSGRDGLMELPGFGRSHRVCVWLPTLRGCELGRIAGNGTFVRAVEGAEEPVLLVLGDSVAQGFTTGDPALAWPPVVSRELGMSLVNQSVGAQVFQESAVAPLPASAGTPALVIVALGANYRYGRCNERVVAREIAAYLERVDELWPSVPLVVLKPHVGARKPVAGSCFERVPALIDDAVARVRRRRMAAGAPAVLSLATPALEERQLSDVDGHPTAAGAAALARFVLGELPKLECRCLAETGRYGRCGACGQAGGKGSAKAGRAGERAAKHAHASGRERAAKPPVSSAPSIEDTPPGQTISMFTLLDE